MDFLLKASLLLIGFYTFYMLWLQKETFFTANRWFLLTGLLLAAGAPAIVIPIYVEAAPLQLDFNTFTTLSNTTTSSFTWQDVLLYSYYIGVALCTVKLFTELYALKSFINQQHTYTENGFKIIETQDQVTPFSFFSWIVYNPNHFSKNELQHILDHEKVHAKQFHSIDILIAKLATIIFWFNPIVWLYKKVLIQNLEFIADSETVQQTTSSKTYQNLLLKTSLPNHQLALTNNFYNSLIKKRIIMLHKSNSNATHYVKYVFIIPLLALFLMSFNTKTVYYSNSTADNLLLIEDGEITGVISKDDNDDQLDALVSTFASQNVVLKIKNIKRNTNNEIISISIDAKSENSKLKYNTDSESPITPIKISFDNATNNLQINSAKTDNNIVFTALKNAEIINSDNSNAFVIHTSDGKSSFVVKKLNDDDQDHNIMFISEDGKTTHVSSKTKEIEWVNEDGKHAKIEEIEFNTDNNIEIKNTIDDNKTPIILLNGKKITKEEMDKLDPDMIKEVTVLKSEQATEKYGEEAKDGVIKITLKD